MHLCVSISIFLVCISLAKASVCPTSLECVSTMTPPTLDGDLSEWSSVNGTQTELYGLAGNVYAPGLADYKCMYNDTHIFFAMEIPGAYRFNSSSNAQCASVAIMFKIGESALYYGMGGCPLASSGCSSGVPSGCDPYRVDIGAHWELASTEQGVEYGVNLGSSDALADDEYAVSPTCRLDDDGSNSGNEWNVAWSYEAFNSTFGDYKFELARSLSTMSESTDRQLSVGQSYSVGFAYWDPNETADGWTDPGHYVTGCAADWMDMTIGQQVSPVKTSSDKNMGSRQHSALKKSVVALGAAGLMFM